MKVAWTRRSSPLTELGPILGVILPLTALLGCSLGPRYSRPTAPIPPSYKEQPPGWKIAQPQDQIARGKWWEIFGDPQLNSLEEKSSTANQSLQAAIQQFLEAKALVRFYRADYYPTVTAAASLARTHASKNRALATSSARRNYTDLLLPLSVSYEPDVFGRLSRTLEAARSQAQASAGDVEALSLSLHADLAINYFQLRTLDAEEQLLDSDVNAFQKALELTQNRHQGGIASAVDVAQAETQLETTRTQALDVQVARAQFEHAIAVLIGEPPSTFSIGYAPWHMMPPVIPVGLPSDLLERRPDVAAAERRVAATNATVGLARTAYFPSLTLTATGGFEGSSISNWLSGPSGFLSAGASALATAFDVGRRRAVSDEAKAAYNQSVANYRQTVLTAVREVEDSLAALRILENEAKTQEQAVRAAERSLELSANRYKGGVVTYLEVITAQTTALNNQRVDIDILRRRIIATVQLIQALGGGWNVSQLPSGQQDSHLPSASGQ